MMINQSINQFICRKVMSHESQTLNSTQLRFIRNTVAGRLKDTHGKNADKQTNKTMKIKE